MTYARVHNEHILGYDDGILVGEIIRNTDEGWQVWHGDTHIDDIWFDDLRVAKQFLESRVYDNEVQ